MSTDIAAAPTPLTPPSLTYDPAIHPNVQIISIAKIVVKDRFRKEFGDILGLAEELKKNGILHPPTVTPIPNTDGQFRLVCGERRYQACIINQWARIPVSVRDNLTPLQIEEIELTENTFRKDFSKLEEIKKIARLDEVKKQLHGVRPRSAAGDPTDPRWSTTKTAELVGLGENHVRNIKQFVDTLKKRPDLEQKLKHLPLSQMHKQMNQILQGEELKRKHDAGLVQVHSDLRRGDALELIRAAADSSVDLVVTDPPFGISTLEELEGEGQGTVQSYTALMKPDDNLGPDTVRTLISNVAPELFRVMKPSTHGYMFHCADLYDHLRYELSRVGFECHSVPLIWDKETNTNAFNGYNYMACYEPILFFWKPPREKRLSSAKNSIIRCKTVPRAQRVHIFQKPQALLKLLIEQSSKLGDMVLDPFAGSGSTVLAALQLKRSAVGFEKNEEHFLAGQRLLEAHKNEATPKVASKEAK